MSGNKLYRLMNIITGLLVFLISAGVYIYTAQPTVAFWDCGEYAGSSAILGIPHPPGNPLFIVIGRLVIMLLAFIPDVAYRLNIFNAVFSAISVMVVYFIAVKMIKKIFKKEDLISLIITIGSGFSGAMFLAFSTTWWFNSVESIVYVLAMLFLLLQTWFMILWYENKEKKDSVRFLYATVYLAFLGIGIHLYTMLIMPVIVVFYLYNNRELAKDWRFYITIFLAGFIVISLKPFLWGTALLISILAFPAFAKVKHGKLLAFGIAAVAMSLFYTGVVPYENDISSPIMVFITILAGVVALSAFSDVQGKSYKKWGFLFTIVAMAVIGYSSHLYLPLRSAANPPINENDPSTWVAFRDFIERKQYGDESMINKMLFNRQGSLVNQFGSHPRMGFGGFFLKQYGNTTVDVMGKGFPILFLIPGILGFIGLFAYYKNDKNIWLFIAGLFVICTIGLVFYMNFSDGTRGVRLEVRDRDYFFTPGFMYFGILISLGMAVVLNDLKKKVPAIVIASMVGVMAILPFGTLMANYTVNTRRNNYFPWDYAYNLLNSCEEGGILFTNGDNDTFPLWYLQEAEGIRQDVIVANLSLLNTPWYISQLKERGLPTHYSDDEIKRISPVGGTGEVQRMQLPGAGISVEIPGERFFRVQDLMVINIVDANRWQRPIYFAVTVGQGNYMGLEPFLQMEAMVYRVMPQRVGQRGNLERTWHLLDNVYRYRGLEKGSDVVLLEEDRKLIINYGAMFVMLAHEYMRNYLNYQSEYSRLEQQIVSLQNRDMADPDEMEEFSSRKEELEKNKAEIKEKIMLVMDTGVEKIGRSDYVSNYYAEILENLEETQKAAEVLRHSIEVNPNRENFENYAILRYDLYEETRSSKDSLYIKELISDLSSKFPQSSIIWSVKADFMQNAGDYEKAIDYLQNAKSFETDSRNKEQQRMRMEFLKRELNKATTKEESIENGTPLDAQ